MSYTGQFGDGVTDNGVKGRFTWLFYFVQQPIGRVVRIDAQNEQDGIERNLHHPGGGECIARLTLGYADDVDALRQALEQGGDGTAHFSL